MKTKKLLYMPIIAMLVLSITAISNNVSATPTPVVYATVHKYDTQADLTGTLFNVTIGVINITDMGAWSFGLTWNSSLLDATFIYGYNDEMPDTANSTDWVPTDGLGVYHPGGPPALNNATDHVTTGALVPAALGQGMTGNFELVKIGFKIIVAPPLGYTPPNPVNITWGCDLVLNASETVFGDSYGAGITVNLQDGEYEYNRPQLKPGQPIASFTWDPLFPYAGDSVTLTDTSNPNGGSIVEWKWTVVSGPATLTGPDNTSITTMDCDGVGDVNVTLFVKDDEGVGLNDTVSNIISQQEKAGGIVDVYTSPNRWCGETVTVVGIGNHTPADSLQPDVNITLFTNVSWNGAPRNHVLVAYEILDNLGRNFLYRTAETDKNGQAYIYFRIPTPCTEQLFGKWFVMVTAKIQDIKYNDTMRFEVGYKITLLNVTVDKDTYYAPSDNLYATVWLKNIMFIEEQVTLAAVVYDDCDVPVGIVTVEITVPAGEYCHPYYMNITLPPIHIPQWTYVGTGKLFVSALTALPKDCGVAYCPELRSADFLLEWSL